MTDSVQRKSRRGADAGPGKRERLVTATTRVLHRQGVERTTLADIATEAEVPVGNVYYYFRTKDRLVEAAIDDHERQLRELIAVLDELPTPGERLRALVGGWVEQRDLAVRYGCPFGTLVSELDKREDDLDRHAAEVMRRLLTWVEEQFCAMGHDADARDLALSLIGAYQGMSLLTNTLRDPDVMVGQGRRLTAWIDSLAGG
ncbi:TetR/AcrR family transcriptional regulator [Embleya sp. NPDC020886]|uniref:TetR/AcrR family transcriptional regulator n=1 Tax=Embleya sp. NPDC020886 TaxID=3363980 RepID=UPI0037B33BF7